MKRLTVFLIILSVFMTNSFAGKFLQTDPGHDYKQDDAMSYNLYTYVRNNPIKNVDPTGKQGEAAVTSKVANSFYKKNNYSSESATTFPTIQRTGELIGAALATVASIATLEVIDQIYEDRDLLTDVKEMTPNEKGQKGVEMSEKISAEKGETKLGNEITFEIPNGKRTRADIVVTDNKGNLKIIESKNGPKAKLTPNQKQAQQAVKQGKSLIPRGQNADKAGLKPGKPVKIKEYQVDHHNK